MKKLVLLFAVVAAFAVVSCTGKKAEATTAPDSAKIAAPAAVDTAKKDTAKVVAPAAAPEKK
jgi:hypothetical protein